MFYPNSSWNVDLQKNDGQRPKSVKHMPAKHRQGKAKALRKHDSDHIYVYQCKTSQHIIYIYTHIKYIYIYIVLHIIYINILYYIYYIIVYIYYIILIIFYYIFDYIL